MTAAQTALEALLTAIDAAEPGPRVHLPEGANMFEPGKILANPGDVDADPVYRDMTPEELAQEAAEAAWCNRNRSYHTLRRQLDAAADAAFNSLAMEAKIAFLESGPHRWAGGEDARHARFKVMVSRGSYAVARLGAEDESTDAAILISNAGRGVETDEMIARLATFQP